MTTSVNPQNAPPPSLDGSSFDAVIIGGGINGAAVARDAALRGLKVCLFEQGDFAGGTSSKSTKIAHGGLRYLRNLEFGLVRESHRERLLMRNLLPHLVTPQSFLYPVYEGGADPLWKVKLGLTVYDVLAGWPSKERHRSLEPAAAIEANPSLRSENLAGALRYWDDRMDDARVCLETVLSAEQAGARCLNYARVVASRRRPRGGFEIDFETGSGEIGSVLARAIVNCAGPWSDGVLTNVLRAPSRQLAPTKGVHIVVPRIAGEDALILDNPRDHRTFFAIPWDDTTLIGTTDTPYDGDPSAVEVEQRDIDYLLEATRQFLPGVNLAATDVIFAFAGLRPLVSQGSNTPAGKISRKHRVAIEPEGVVTLIGGKYTTFRQMAEDATDALLEALDMAPRPSSTKTASYFAAVDPRNDRRADLGLWASMVARYGPRAGAVFDVCLAQEELRQPVIEGFDLRWGELVFAVLQEKARTLDDLIYRRTRLAWRPELDDALRAKIGATIDRYLPGWQGSAAAS
ncbi:MAG: FAD-dependent oxidoreductase [Dehalococcoidia bacterium]